MDDATMQLMISLQLQDIEDALQARKGKERAGDVSSDQVALESYREHLQATSTYLSDLAFARSLDRATREDEAQIRTFVQQEITAHRDHQVARLIAGISDDEDEDTYHGPTEGPSSFAYNPSLATSSSTLDLSESSITLDNETVLFESSSLHLQHSEDEVISKELQNVVESSIEARCCSCLEDKNCVTVPCADTYCFTCLKTVFLAAATDEELFPPRCCRREIPVDAVQPLLNIDELARILLMYEEFTSKERLYCFQSSCNNRFIPSSNRKGDVGTCPQCSRGTCMLCGCGQHKGDCPEDEELTRTLRLAAGNGWQRCLQCHALIEFTYGCRHMVCR